jgi:hypothetical protein
MLRGSAYSGRRAERSGRTVRGSVAIAVGGIAVMTIADVALPPRIFQLLIGFHNATKIAVSLVLIALLAYCMGMPFPLALKKTAELAPDFIPWVWGVNGDASELSATLATLQVIEFGFTAVVLLALLLYACAVAMLQLENKAGRS